jgi:hypothetical protein
MSIFYEAGKTASYSFAETKPRNRQRHPILKWGSNGLVARPYSDGIGSLLRWLGEISLE